VKAIVLTTINVPKNVLQFVEKADGEWIPIVVGDLKTPHEAVKAICKAAHGVYLSPEDQNNLGFSYAQAIPWNCYDRKNLGYLFALREGAEIIYSIDDGQAAYQSGRLRIRLVELLFAGGCRHHTARLSLLVNP
jgi:hypothetical protein